MKAKFDAFRDYERAICAFLAELLRDSMHYKATLAGDALRRCSGRPLKADATRMKGNGEGEASYMQEEEIRVYGRASGYSDWCGGMKERKKWGGVRRGRLVYILHTCLCVLSQLGSGGMVSTGLLLQTLEAS